MVMHTAEAPAKGQKLSMRDVPNFNGIDEMLGAVKALLESDGSAIKERGQDIDEVLRGIHTHTIMMQNHMNLLMGNPVDLEQVHATYVADTMYLELANNWWKTHRIVLDAPINQCRNAMLAAFMMQASTPAPWTEEEVELIYLETTKRYDFIPWVVFVATGNLGLYGSAQILLSKWRRSITLDGFIKAYQDKK